MITLPAGTQIWIAAGLTDLRRGFTGLSAIVQVKLEQDPFAGHVFVFRGRRGDLIKVLWWDGDGLCLFAKRSGAWTVHLAASRKRNGIADTSAVIDAAGRDRLETSGPNQRSASSRLGLATKAYNKCLNHRSVIQ